MGCTFSNSAVRVIGLGEDKDSIMSDADLDSLGEKSLDSAFSLNGSIDSDKITLYSGSEYVHPHYHRSKSVDLSRKRSIVTSENPPVGAATIIINKSATVHSSSEGKHTSESLKDQKTEHHQPPPNIILNPPQKDPEKSHVKQRRASESDVSKIKNGTCIHSNSLFPTNLKELRVKPLNFGPRSSRLVLTESQKDFFKMLDEKVAQGKDYSSEDEKSIASFRSSIFRKESTESNKHVTSQIIQEVR